MTQGRMRVAVVGANGSNDHWADTAHVRAVAAVDDAELVAVCTAHEESAKRAQEKYGTRLAFWDFRELMRSPEIDLVTVGVRVSRHHPVSVEALREGKHVVCEWPLAVDLQQAQSMASLARERGLGNAVDTQAYFSPGIMYGKELMDQGYVGRPLQFHMTHYTATGFEPRKSDRAWQARAEEGGAVNIVGGHALAVLRWYLGEVARVNGVARTLVPEMRWTDTGELAKVTSFDTLVCVAQMQNEAIGSVHTSQAAIGAMGFRLVIHGTEGRLLVETGGMVQYSPAGVHGARGNDPLAELPVPDRFTQIAKLPEGDRAFQLAQLLQTFISSIRAKSAFHPSFDDAVRLHAVIEAVKRSSQSGAWEIPAVH